MLVLVVGAGGQLGEAAVSMLGHRHEVVAWTRAELDVTAGADAFEAVSSLCPDIILNCSAFTAVDRAESEPREALAVNAWAVRALARAAEEIDATLVHYSTDFIFDGETDRPYVETDPPNPRSTYASSKLLGEWFAAEVPRHYVLRVESLFGGPRRKSSIDHFVTKIQAGEEIRAFSDRIVSPSYVDDVVMATMGLVERNAAPGVYHCVNTGCTTWSQLAREIAVSLDHPDARIVETRMADSGLLANRPRFAALSNEKLANAGVTMPTWQDAVRRHIQKLQTANFEL